MKQRESAVEKYGVHLFFGPLSDSKRKACWPPDRPLPNEKPSLERSRTVVTQTGERRDATTETTRFIIPGT